MLDRPRVASGPVLRTLRSLTHCSVVLNFEKVSALLLVCARHAGPGPAGELGEASAWARLPALPGRAPYVKGRKACRLPPACSQPAARPCPQAQPLRPCVARRVPMAGPLVICHATAPCTITEREMDLTGLYPLRRRLLVLTVRG